MIWSALVTWLSITWERSKLSTCPADQYWRTDITVHQLPAVRGWIMNEWPTMSHVPTNQCKIFIDSFISLFIPILNEIHISFSKVSANNVSWKRVCLFTTSSHHTIGLWVVCHTSAGSRDPSPQSIREGRWWGLVSGVSETAKWQASLERWGSRLLSSRSTTLQEAPLSFREECWYSGVDNSYSERRGERAREC